MSTIKSDAQCEVWDREFGLQVNTNVSGLVCGILLELYNIFVQEIVSETEAEVQ